jgi:crotonobetainyl-CoA:carnitine CoA-transferase CaiB-like acyl-CoA transferase
MKKIAPQMGQHNVEVAQKLGYSTEQIHAMQTDGVLFSK